MSSPNIFTDTTPVLDPDDPTLAHCVITDAWGLFYAQGGVVMAAALRSAAAVLERDDLTLSSASGTFCMPVACGPVTVRVDVLRSGRRGAQVVARLRDQNAGEDQTNVVVTAVFTDPTLDGPTLTPMPRPAELAHTPAPGAVPAGAPEDTFPLGFLDNTEWHHTTLPGVGIGNSGPLPRIAVWFRFTSPPAAPGEPWEPALLPIPGDALGSALTVALADGDQPIGSVSLQMDIHVHAPVVGEWIGIDSTATFIGNGLANGVLALWSEDGTHVATVTQSAMLRSF